MPQHDCLFHGVCDEARATLIATLNSQSTAETIIVIVNQFARIRELAGEIEACSHWFKPKKKPDILLFPEEPAAETNLNQQADTIYERLITLRALLSTKRKQLLIVSTPEAILGTCPRRDQFEQRQLQLKVGKSYSFRELVDTLVQDFDYDSEALCEYPGQVAVRGGLVDVYPFDASQPYRLDFFGDTLESIRSFDPGSQRTEASIKEITLSSAGNVESLQSDSGNFIRYLSEAPINWIFDNPSQLIRDYPMRFDEVPMVGDTISTFDHVFAARKTNSDQRIGICLVDTDPRLFRQSSRSELSTEPVSNYGLGSTSVINLEHSESDFPAHTGFEDTFADWIKKERLALYFTISNDRDAEQIAEKLAQNPRTAKLKPRYLTGTLSGGFLCRGNPAWLPLKQTKASKGIVLISADDFFGRRRRKVKQARERARPTLSQVDQLLDFSELTDGDALVHLQHGICIFRGLSKIKLSDGPREMITVEFAEQMTLHVPLDESHLLTRYVGLKKSNPKLSTIGAGAWEKNP